jgi:hypothetical protein
LSAKIPQKFISYQPFGFQVKRLPAEAVSRAYTEVLLPTEIGRRSRPIDYSNFKSREWIVLALYCHQCIIKAIPKSSRPYIMLRRLWKVMISLVRLYLLPPTDYDDVLRRSNNSNRLDALHKEFYITYQRLFSQRACTYNVHAFSHLKKIREFSPLTSVSAFPFEDMYGSLRKCFAVGTTSVGLQAFENYANRIYAGHSCRKVASYRASSTLKRCDSLIMTNGMRFWQIEEVDRTTRTLTCFELEKATPVHAFRNLLPEEHGVFIYKGRKETRRTLPMSAVTGKVVRCRGFLSAMPLEVLLE